MISLSEIKIDIQTQIEKMGDLTAYKFSFYRKDGDERIRTIVECRDLEFNIKGIGDMENIKIENMRRIINNLEKELNDIRTVINYLSIMSCGDYSRKKIILDEMKKEILEKESEVE